MSSVIVIIGNEFSAYIAEQFHIYAETHDILPSLRPVLVCVDYIDENINKHLKGAQKVIYCTSGRMKDDSGIGWFQEKFHQSQVEYSGITRTSTEHWVPTLSNAAIVKFGPIMSDSQRLHSTEEKFICETVGIPNAFWAPLAAPRLTQDALQTWAAPINAWIMSYF